MSQTVEAGHSSDIAWSAEWMAKVDRIEILVGEIVKRDISRLLAFSKGSLHKAATSIAQTSQPHIGIVAGFYIKHATPPSPETDGLNGMAHLAAGFVAAGFRVTVITDAPCAKAVWATVDALPHKVELRITDTSSESVVQLRNALEADPHPITHMIAIERVAPGSDGKPHREHGWDMTRETAPLDLLFEGPDWKSTWTTIGIGDGGNEIGMGALPDNIVAEDIPNGPLIAAQTSCDYLIVSGVSNWGAYGLLAAVSIIRPDIRSRLLLHFTPEKEKLFLEAAVTVGQAVDDSRVDRPGTLQMSVDRLPLEIHAALIETIAAVCGE
ncbi:MAG: hypothetical protein JWR21_3988 [Herminiimonas sp.]|nr:hypothetical protein [Herminiimonas sp.]